MNYPSQDNIVMLELMLKDSSAMHDWLDAQFSGRWTYGNSPYCHGDKLKNLSFDELAKFLRDERVSIYSRMRITPSEEIVVHFRIVDLCESDVAILRMSPWRLCKYQIAGQDRVVYRKKLDKH